MDDPRLPVTLITGFLGAGKTTLLNAILADGSEKVAVIVNEFGEAGLDHDLIEESSADVVLMPSGCLCCSVRGDLPETVQKLIGQKWDNKLDFDRIVIETTGLADPGPIMQTLLVDRFLGSTTRLDGVVTVADAANGPSTLKAQFEAVSQVAIADLIVLSKSDLVEDAALQRFEAQLRDLNASAKIVRSVRGDGVQNQLWNLTGLRPDAQAAEALSWVQNRAADPLAGLSGLTPPPQTSRTPLHTDRITTASFVVDAPLTDEALDNWLHGMLHRFGQNILRIKGIVFLDGIDLPFVFHAVQHIVDPPVQLKSWPDEDRRSRIVVIARDLTQDTLQSSFGMLEKPSQSAASVI